MRSIFRFFKSLFGSNTPTPRDTVKIVPPSDKPGLYLGAISGVSGDEHEMIKRAVNMLEAVFASPDFQDAVLSSTFTSNDGYSNAAIYHMITKTPLVASVTMFTGSFRQNHIYHTVGLDVGDGVVYANRYFVQDAFTMMSLIAHELMHQLGFHHQSANERTSVPYAMNDIVESIATKLKIK